jgi:hypothetical protein
MKRILWGSSVMMLVMVFSFGTVFAMEKTKPTKINQTILINTPVCGKLLSIKNDGTMKETSPTQRYRLVCENKGQKVTATMEVTFSKSGAVKEAKIIREEKAMGTLSLKVVRAIAAHEHCITQCTKNSAGDLV